MPELTIAVHAHNAAPHIARAIDSVLQQNDGDFELIVVDDGSTDDTAKRMHCFADRKMTLITNDRHRGAAYCYNLALKRSQSDFIVVVRGDGIVLPGALRKLLDACRSRPTIGLAHCYYFEIDADDKTTRDRFRIQRAMFQELFTPETDYPKALLRYGNIVNHLPIYSKKVFETVGRFDETIGVDADYDMALKIADRFEIEIVSEYLYCHRNLDPDKRKSRRRKLIDWARRFVHCRRLLKTHTLSFLNDRKYFRKLMALGLYDSLRLAPMIRARCDRLLGSFWKVYDPVQATLYDLLVERLSSRPLSLSSSNGANEPGQNQRIAYYTWHFPVLSQTFINRELAALKQSGISVEIFADEPEDVELADDNARLLLGDTRYLEPLDNTLLRGYRRHFFRAHPLVYVKLFGFVVLCRYSPYKTIYEDIAVFSRAVYLAGMLKDRHIDHIHAPWSDRCALVAMLAAKLAGVTYSVQARAHDIHRKSYLFALQEKFEPARFIITNTRYNESYMKTFLGEAHWPKLRVIHNGLDLQRFTPKRNHADRSATTKLLCVARLIEQKGLVYLLQACGNLRDKGYFFECEIIGGTEDIYMNYYLELKKLHKLLGLENQVRFLYSLPFNQVLKKYSQADIFVLPCVIAGDGSRDITPNALIEAMAMKLPVISTTVTGVPEIVEDGVSGVLVPPNDVNALTLAMIDLIHDCHRRRQLGENARRRVEEKFDINKNVGRYIELFQEGVAPA